MIQRLTFCRTVTGLRRCTLGALPAALLWHTGFARAQAVLAPAPAASSATSRTAPDGVTTLETITITAEKRAGDLQKAPLAVTAISATSLDKSNIYDLSGLNGMVPGLSIAKSSGYERVVTIRGIGLETPENAYTAQPGVALHIDGVYIANSISLDQSLFDLDRIEVLRGPQGTLYGQSSTGGTINLITKQPVLGELSGAGDLSVGNYRLHRERAELNVPLGSQWAVRASVQEYGHRGFANATAIPGGYPLDDAHDHGVKLAALWKPGADFSATLTGQWYRLDQNGAAQKSIVDPNPDPRAISQDFPGKLALESNLYHANFAWTLPWATLKSITAYQKLHHTQQQDSDRLNAAFLTSTASPYTYDAIAAWTTRLKNTTQEFNLSSLPGGPIDWIVGAFGMRQRSSQYVVEFSGSEADPVLAIPAGIETSPPSNLEFGEDTTARRSSYSVFFQSTWHATDRLRLTAGARDNHDAYDTVIGSFAGAPFNDGVNPRPIGRTTQRFSGNTPTGKVALDYDLTPDSLLYASLTRGYKPGGLNGNQTPVVVGKSFVAETVDSFEVGSKNRLLNNTARVNVAAFYYRYRNMQYLEVDPVPFNYGIANIPKTQIWGGEAEASLLTLSSRLRFNANLTLMNGRFAGDYRTIDATTAQQVYASNPACAFGGQFYNPACWNAVADAAKGLNGNRPAKLPSLQGSVDVSYAQPLPSGTLTSRLQFIHRGDFNYRVFNEGAVDRVPSYGIVNLNFEYQPYAADWTVSIAGSNLANRAGVNSRFTDPYGRGATSQETIAPRQIIATLGYAF